MLQNLAVVAFCSRVLGFLLKLEWSLLYVSIHDYGAPDASRTPVLGYGAIFYSPRNKFNIFRFLLLSINLQKEKIIEI